MTPRSQVSLAEFKSIVRKGSVDPFWFSNVFWRPVSYWFSWIAVLLGMTANAVTFLSLVPAVASAFVLLLDWQWKYLASAGLMQVYHLLDQVDGEVARYWRAARRLASSDRSGPYSDRLIHYFHQPAFFAALGVALFLESGERIWVALGLIASVGSSGFPRFVAAYEMMELLARVPTEEARVFVREEGGYYAAYWKKGGHTRYFFLLPKNRGEVVYMAKQLVGFPGFLFEFALAAGLAAVAPGGVGWLHLYLGFYAAVFGANAVFVTDQYRRVLARVPPDTEEGQAPAPDERLTN